MVYGPFVYAFALHNVQRIACFKKMTVTEDGNL